jgi:hypothetical protein
VQYPPFNPKAQKLLIALDGNVTKPQYQKGYEKWGNGKPKTYCNIFAVKIGALLGYDMRSFFKDHDPANEYNTVMTQIYNQLNVEVQSIPSSAAQGLANIGELVIVWSASHEHAAVVSPDVEPYDENRGPLVVQAGWYNGKMYMSSPKCFGKIWTDPEIKYFVPKEVKKDGE